MWVTVVPIYINFCIIHTDLQSSSIHEIQFNEIYIYGKRNHFWQTICFWVKICDTKGKSAPFQTFFSLRSRAALYRWRLPCMDHIGCVIDKLCCKIFRTRTIWVNINANWCIFYVDEDGWKWMQINSFNSTDKNILVLEVYKFGCLNA